MKIYRFHQFGEMKALLEKANLYNEEHQMAAFNMAKAIEVHLSLYPGLGFEMVFQ